MNARGYEEFVRAAFALWRGSPVSAHGDPARLAAAGTFTPEDLAAVKVTTGYAMEVFSSHIFNDLTLEVPDEEFKRMKAFTKAVITVDDLPSVAELIDLFRDTVVARYCPQALQHRTKK